MKKDRTLSNILFFFGIILLIFSLGLLGYQIYETCLMIQLTWPKLAEDARLAVRSYYILQFVNIAAKLVIASYGIYSRKHVDEAINPLFTFTILFTIFVTLQIMSFVTALRTTDIVHSHPIFEIDIATLTIDLIVAVFYLIVTIILKMDDWRGIEED